MGKVMKRTKNKNRDPRRNSPVQKSLESICKARREPVMEKICDRHRF